MSPELLESPFASAFHVLHHSHITVGGGALVLGALQMVLPHGGTTHRALGRFYVLCMMFSFATSMPMSLYTGNIFLSIIGVFSFYMALTGQRLYVAAIHGRFSTIDKALSVLFGFSALLMAAFSVYYFARGASNAGIVLGVFTIIFGSMTIADLRDMWGKNRPNVRSYWKYRHIGRMVGSYIAAVTAFLANVQPFGSTLLNWLLPTVIGTTFIWYQIRKYKLAAEEK
jgi:uncharacterized membrane protein